MIIDLVQSRKSLTVERDQIRRTKKLAHLPDLNNACLTCIKSSFPRWRIIWWFKKISCAIGFLATDQLTLGQNHLTVKISGFLMKSIWWNSFQSSKEILSVGLTCYFLALLSGKNWFKKGNLLIVKKLYVKKTNEKITKLLRIALFLQNLKTKTFKIRKKVFLIISGNPVVGTCCHVSSVFSEDFFFSYQLCFCSLLLITSHFHPLCASAFYPWPTVS